MTHPSVNSPALAKRGRPRDEGLQERRREEILEKASTIFAKLGYPNTDVQFIADPLGISKGTIYRYFPSKEKLFLAAVERGVKRLQQHIDQAVAAEPDGLWQMAAAMRAYLAFFSRHPELAELFIQERAEFRDGHTPIYFALDDDCPEWRTRLEELMDAGRIRRMPPERVMDVIGDLAHGTMFTNHLSGRKRPHEEQAAAILDIVFNGIVTGPERARPQRPDAADGSTTAKTAKTPAKPRAGRAKAN